MDTIKNIKIFIGSPSDTSEERNCVPDILMELNQTFGKDHGVHIDSLTWEQDVQPTVGADGQDVINSQVEGYDVFVGMMWKKYGFPTPRANSATDEEYTHAINSFKEGGHCRDVIMLFCNKSVPVDVDASQLQLVQEFRKRVANDGVYYKTYSNKEEFCSILRIALYNRLSKLLEKEKSDKQKKNKKQIVVPQVTPLDDNTKLVFDTLANSPTINDMKIKFIESYILLYLYEQKQATVNEIIVHLEQKLGDGKKVLYNNVLSKLNNTECLCADNSAPKLFSLSGKKRKEIDRIKKDAETSTACLISGCREICEKYDIEVAPEGLNQYVCRLFEVSFSSETSEWTRIARKNEETLKSVYVDLVTYLQNATSLGMCKK